jgi:hypothetical protein
MPSSVIKLAGVKPPPAKPESFHKKVGAMELPYGATHGCQTARQNLWGGLAAMGLVMMSVLDVSVFVATESQLVKLLEL